MRKIRRNQKRQARRSRLTKRTLAAGAAAAITIAAGAAIEKTFAATPDPHQLPVKQDADGDLLADREEFAIGYDPFNPDQNRNLLLDGAELANRCRAVIEQLPTNKQAGPNDIYKMESPAVDGGELCDVCGQWVYMGGWYIINPRLALKYPEPNDPTNWEFLPELALHYMQHGSFDYAGEVHKGRVDIPRLLRTLELRFPFDPNNHHLPPDGNDLDGDLLADLEELAAGFDLYDPDQDDNLTPDGIDLAAQCAAAIELLPEYDPDEGRPEPAEPYKVNHLQRGLEWCAICGTSVNMGWWTFVNPKRKLSYDAYDIVLHYMTHGSFGHQDREESKIGQFHVSRVDVPLLVELLEIPNECGHLGAIYLPGDYNKDCKEDFKDLARFAENWLDSTDPNQPAEPPDSQKTSTGSPPPQ